MLMLFSSILFVGIFLSIYMYKNMKRVKRLRQATQSVDHVSIYSKFSLNRQTETAIEKQDVLLTRLRHFDENVVLKIIIGFLIFILICFISNVFNANLSRTSLSVIAMLSLVAAILIPSWIRKFIVEMRIANIGKNIPMFVDLLAVCVQAGMNIESAMKFLEGNISNINKDFAPFLNRMIAKSEISGLYAALDDLEEELPSTEIMMMCTTLKQSLKYGSAIYDALMALSMEIRELELLRTEEAIGKLSAKMSVPLILFFMFPVIIIIAAPGIIKVMGSF